MKILITLTILLSSFCAAAQDDVYSSTEQKSVLKRNEVDEFTGATVRETGWALLLPASWQTVNFRIRKVDDAYLFDLKWMGSGAGDVTSIAKGDKLMLKLKDGKIVHLVNRETTISCLGCGATGFMGSKAPGISTTYDINVTDVSLIKATGIEKLRLYTTDGYVDKELKEKHSANVVAALNAVDNAAKPVAQ